MKRKFIQLMASWLALLCVGLLDGESVQAQSIPDLQWTKSGAVLTVTTDGGIVTTQQSVQQNSIPGFPSVAGDRVLKYSPQGNLVWQTDLLKGGYYLGGKIQGYDFEAIGAILPGATTDGGVGIVGKLSLRGNTVATKIDANGLVRRWEESDLFFGSSTGTSLLTAIIGTPDGGYLVMLTDKQTNLPTQTVIRKYDASGNFSWAKQIAYPTPTPPNPDLSLTEGKAVINAPDGGYLIVGYYNNLGIAYNPLNSFGIEHTGWLAKLDGSGNVVWQKLLSDLPITQTGNGPAAGSVRTVLVATDVTLAADGNGYALVGPSLEPGGGIPPPKEAILELDWNGNFKRARQLGVEPTQAFITLYGSGFYAVGHTSLASGADPRVLKVSAANLPQSDPDLFKVVAQRTFDSSVDGYLKKMERAGDGGIVLVTTSQQLMKLQADTPLPFALRAPSYNCQTGSILFNVIGGDGSPITYTAPGITRASVTDNTGIVEPGIRNDPKVIMITASQSGKTVTYNFDLKAACPANIPKLPIFNGPLPDQVLAVGQPFPGNGNFLLGMYFTDPNVCIQGNENGCLGGYVPNWAVEVSGLPSGMSLFTNNLLYAPNPQALIGGTANSAGVYTVNVKVSTGAYRDFPIITSFKIIVSDNTPPISTPFALMAPGYDCSTGAFTFKTTGGNGSQIEYQAAGITGWTTNPNQFVDKESRMASDVKPFTLMARQSGNVVTYVWDLKATCSGTPALKPPVVSPIPDLTYTVGESVYFVLGGYFSDPNLGQPTYVPNWSITTSELPQALSLFVKSSELMYTPAVVIIGTANAPGVYTVNASAHTTGGSVAATFKITILPGSQPPVTPLALIAPDYSCSTGAITFKTTGGDGTVIEYQAPGITGWTTNPNQFVDKESRTASDVKPFTLMARQGGNVVTYVWDLKAVCGRARVGIDELGTGLQVRVLGNPVEGRSAEVEIRGADGKSVQLNLIDSRGDLLHQFHIHQAQTLERVSVPIGRAQGILLLQVGTATEQKTLKLLKP